MPAQRSLPLRQHGEVLGTGFGIQEGLKDHKVISSSDEANFGPCVNASGKAVKSIHLDIIGSLLVFLAINLGWHLDLENGFIASSGAMKSNLSFRRPPAPDLGRISACQS